MPLEESQYSDDWVRLAERDLKRVRLLLAEGDAELAGFCLQQALEKFLKAYLLAHGWRLRRIHNLDSLLDDALSFDVSLESFRMLCQRISAFYMIERYPLVIESGIIPDDVLDCLTQAEKFISRLRSGLHR